MKNKELFTKDYFQKAAIPSSVLPHSIATASLVAQIMYQKFMMGIPLSRQEKDWYRLGLVLPRNNMVHWLIRCSEEWLTPIYNRIHSELMKCDCLHMDETRIQCNKKKEEKSAQIPSLFADTPKGATANAVLYTLVKSAKANNLDVYEYIHLLLCVCQK